MEKITTHNPLIQRQGDCSGIVMKALNTKSITTTTTPIVSCKTQLANEYKTLSTSTTSTTSTSHHLKKSLTEQHRLHGSCRSFESPSTCSASLRLNFRKSHTCGSLFANCSCRTPSPVENNISDGHYFRAINTNRHSIPLIKRTNGNLYQRQTPAGTTQVNNRHSSSLSLPTAKSYSHSSQDISNVPVNNNNNKKDKKLFQSYSHPDTAFIFTDENKNPTKDAVLRHNSIITTKDGQIEIKHPQRQSSPNIGNYTILDVAVHPEILLKVSTRNTPPKDSIVDSESLDNASSPPNLSHNKSNRPALRRTQREYQSSDSENSIEVINDPIHSPTISELDLHRRHSGSFHQSRSQGSSRSEDSTDHLDIDNLESPLANESSTTVNSTNINRKEIDNLEYLKYNALSYQQLGNQNNVNLDPAHKFFQESGILGPITASSSNLIRKTSKIVQDPNLIEQIRKNSKMLRNQTDSRKVSPAEEFEYARSVVPNLKVENNDDRDVKVKALEDAVLGLKDIIKNRDSEIYKLKREIHKLKSVLQQTAKPIPIADDDLLSSLQTRHRMAVGQNHVNSHSNSNTKPIANNLTNGQRDNETYPISPLPGDIEIKISPVSNFCECQSGIPKNMANVKRNHLHSTGPVVKKQGVSGESSDAVSHQSTRIPIPKYEKDFSSKQLIKDAIMDNDFLKNIDSSQVRELVESMYSLDVAKGEYVIREGEAGAHLYVSADGEFEVIKGEKVLGTMGPGKAFGELAILYNCTRTASIRVLSDAKVWVLDRRVFQQIMMRTGMQRIQENVNFLKSVPLLKNLPNDVLTKIADVLEVEFYPAGAYIIRQGASGDTFFLISQGTVKVTQRLANGCEEKEIRTLERGDYFGEQALINEDKRTANIIALQPGVECLTLDRDSFTQLIGDLCELKEKDYGDENRVLAMKFSEKTREIFGANVKQELPELCLSDLEVVTTLGIGGFGRVELVKCYRENNVKTFALKCLKKQHIVDTRQEEHVFSERTIMLSCHTPFICRLYRTFRDEKYVYMLLEACMGGEVWTILRDRSCFDDNTTQFIIGCVLQAFEYLHSRGIIYRDLKPENLMLDERGYVKLVDFGFAKYIGHSSKTWTFCGTPEYVAPEIILNKGHDRAVDYWALGILIHELLNGTPPFTATDPMKTYNIILKGIDMIDFPKHMSRSAVTLIKRLCRDVPAERLGYQKGGIQDIKKHKWFQGFDWDGLSNLTLIPPFLRPVSHSLDTSYFDKFAVDNEIPPDEKSGWDADF